MVSLTRVWFVVNIFFSVAITVAFLYLNHRRVGQTSNSKQSQLDRVKRDKQGTSSSKVLKAKWHLIRQNTFCISAEPPKAGQLYLTPGTSVYLERCNPADPLQHFRYDKKSKQIIAKLTSKHDDWMCLDVYNVQHYAGSVQLYTCHKSGKAKSNQKWEIGKKSGKERYRVISKTKRCLTSRNREALGEKAWGTTFFNMPQQFKDHHKTRQNDIIAVRHCADGYNFFYTRMQRWRFTAPTSISMDESIDNQHQLSRISSHDGVTILLTVSDVKDGESIAQELSFVYPGMSIIILSGSELSSQSNKIDFHYPIIGINEFRDNNNLLLSLVKTEFVVVMGASNRLMPDFDLYSLIETLEGDPSLLAAAGFLQDDKTLYRPCYTAMEVPASKVADLKAKSKKRDAHDLVNTTDFYSIVQLSKFDMAWPPEKEKQTRFEVPESDDENEKSETKKVWVEGYFQVSKSATMACDRSSKPIMVRKANLLTILEPELNRKDSDAKWKPKELVDGKNFEGVMQRIGVNPAFRSRTTAYTCSKDAKTFTPLEDCFLPPDNMERPISISDAWSENSPCRKVSGATAKRKKVRLFSQALEHFGRFIYKMPYYFMDGTLLGIIKLGTFSPWDSDIDVMLEMPLTFKKTKKNVENLTRMLYAILVGMDLSVREKMKKKGTIFKWINPSTFHTYIPVKDMWIHSWFNSCKKNSDYTINESWESCLKKLKNETLIYTRGYYKNRMQTDLHMTYPVKYFGKDTKLTGNLRIADKNSFYYVPYHFIESLHWWYDQDRLLRNPWDCEWKYPLYYPPYKTKPAT